MARNQPSSSTSTGFRMSQACRGLPMDILVEVVEFHKWTNVLRLITTSQTINSLAGWRLSKAHPSVIQTAMAYQQIKGLYTRAHPNHPVVTRALFDIGMERGEGVRWVNQGRHLFQFLPVGADGRDGYQVLADAMVRDYGGAGQFQYTADHVKAAMKGLRDGDGMLAFIPGLDNKYQLNPNHSTQVMEGSGTPDPNESQEE